MARLMRNITILKMLSFVVSSYTSNGSRIAVARNVRYSAQRLANQSPTISVASRAA